MLYGPLDSLLTAVTMAFTQAMIVIRQLFYDYLINYESNLEAKVDLTIIIHMNININIIAKFIFFINILTKIKVYIRIDFIISIKTLIMIFT